MEIKQFDIWLVDSKTSMGAEPGKTIPVVVIQTNLLNDVHFSTLICPITTNVKLEIDLLRVHLNNNQLDKVSDILVDQIRVIDNKRFLKKLSKLTKEQQEQLKSNLKIVMDL
ncbi:MAG: type II toxin-antitoxin system PemK/MazF family toxin [Bacteroidota bacterium]|jgi:mRNA interferase MazF